MWEGVHSMIQKYWNTVGAKSVSILFGSSGTIAHEVLAETPYGGSWRRGEKVGESREGGASVPA